MKHPPAPGLDTEFEGEIAQKTRVAALRTVFLLIGVIGAVLVLLMQMAERTPVELLAASGVSLTGWIALILMRCGLSRYMPPFTIVCIGLSTSMALLSFGSVRAAASFVFVAIVAGAGTFLGRTALIATMVACITILGLFNWAELNGMLNPPNFRVGMVVWLTHSAVIVVVGVIVYHSRTQAWLAFDNQSKELARRQRTEMERDLSMERFGLIFRTNPLPMVAQSAHNGVILDVNPAFELLYGHTKAAMVGKTDECLWANSEERDHHLERLRAKLGSVKASVTGKRADGSEFTAIIGSDISQGPRDRLLITTVTDISQERRLQAQLLSLAGGLVASTHEALFTPLTMHMAEAIEADTVVVSELQDADRARTLAVWKSGRNEPNFVFEVQGTPCAEAFEKPDLCVRTLENTNQGPHTEFLLSEGYRVCAGLALRSDDGTPIGLLNALWRQPIELPAETQALITIFASRATAELLRLRSERALAQLNDTLEQRVAERTAELQKLNAELDSFAYSISHDLKSPLRAIDGFTQLLSERLAARMDPEERRLMDRVLGATHRTANLMADLLALTRVSQQPLHIERINLSMMAQEELDQCLIKQPRVNLESRIELGLVVYADAPLTRLMLKSLIDNAVKYTRDQTHPLIEIGCAVNAPPNANEAAKSFFIRDNGAGFSMAHADKLIKPFQRLHMPSAGFEGTGIGLATVRRIVERHGGAISGTGMPNQGAEFRFWLKQPVPAKPQTT